MRTPGRGWFLSIGVTFFLAASVAWGGMAELGARRTVNLGPGPEAFDDVATGGGVVTLRANDQVFFELTSSGQTVDDILELLEGQVNATSVLMATHDAASDEITVHTASGGEVAQLSLENTDVGFEFVSVSRSSGTHNELVTVGVNGVPAGGEVRVAVNFPTGCDVTVGTTGLTHAQLVDALVFQLNLAGCDATPRQGNEIRVNRVFSLGAESTRSLLDYSPEELALLPSEPAEAVLWEDSDSGITTIRANSRLLPDFPGDVQPDSATIPTLSEWGLAMMILLLLAAGFGRLRRVRS